MSKKLPLWTSADVLKATDGEGEGEWDASGVSIDSRTVKKGDIFIALKGENHDGHDHVNDALKKGAVAAIVAYMPANFSRKNGHLVEVEDTMVALRKLAQHRRAATKAKIIGVTGSVGKTTVKEGIATVLSKFGRVHFTQGNYNNHIGLPLTLVQMPLDTEYAVLEMGMNHAGEIRAMVKIAKPHISVITAIEAVHIEFFDSVAGIAKAKAEIFDSMAESPIAVIPTSTPHHDLLEKVATQHGIKKIFHAGLGLKANYRLVGRQDMPEGQDISANIEGKFTRYMIPLVGKHHAINSLTILAAVHACGFELYQILPLMASIALPEGRGAVMDLTLKTGKQKSITIQLMDDSYNASPASVKAALEVLGQHRKVHGGRAIAVLGDMLELGADGPAMHTALLPDIQENAIDKVYVSGAIMPHLFKSLSPAVAGAAVEDPLTLLPILQKELQDGDTVLVKGSHGSHMYQLAATLKKEGAKKASAAKTAKAKTPHAKAS